jgi:hypothetical protein
MDCESRNQYTEHFDLRFALLTDVDDARGRHIMQQLVHQFVVLSVQLVLRDLDVEQFQVAHVLPVTQTEFVVG